MLFYLLKISKNLTSLASKDAIQVLLGSPAQQSRQTKFASEKLIAVAGYFADFK